MTEGGLVRRLPSDRAPIPNFNRRLFRYRQPFGRHTVSHRVGMPLPSQRDAGGRQNVDISRVALAWAWETCIGDAWLRPGVRRRRRLALMLWRATELADS